jgi:coiled-coil domain-containing protein 12
MDAAAERKQRLKALKEAQRLAEAKEDSSAGAAPEAAAAAEPEKPVLKFRNYVVKDQKIAHEQVRPLAPPVGGYHHQCTPQQQRVRLPVS